VLVLVSIVVTGVANAPVLARILAATGNDGMSPAVAGYACADRQAARDLPYYYKNDR
jgi:hypothetical protein